MKHSWREIDENYFECKICEIQKTIEKTEELKYPLTTYYDKKSVKHRRAPACESPQLEMFKNQYYEIQRRESKNKKFIRTPKARRSK